MSETPLAPKDHAEAMALFRAGVIGGLRHRELTRGELRRELDALSRQRFRPPGASRTRTFGVSTLERWYYAYRDRGLEGLRSRARNDRGRARHLSPEQRDLLRNIRREHPAASVPLIFKTLKRLGFAAADTLSVATLRRFYHQEGLERGATPPKAEVVRLRWQAERPHALWHGDVCHAGKFEIGGQTHRILIHGLLDDRSRSVIALEPLEAEREIDMLRVFVRALLAYGRPDALYLDNGSTYRGEGLKLACERLGITLLHAQPFDPEARGKMERFWRTAREHCLNFLGKSASLHDVRARLTAFAREYQHSPHAGLMGDHPARVLGGATGRPVSESEARAALMIESRRRVRTDSTLSLGGQLYQVTERFLGGRVVAVRISLLDQKPEPYVELDGRRYALEPVDTRLNAATPRKVEPTAKRPTTDFDPNAARLAALIQEVRDADEGEDS